MEGVGENTGERGKIGDTHDLGNASVIPKTVRRDQCADHGSSRDKVNGSIWAVMSMSMVSLVVTKRLEEVLESMRDEIESTKEEEDGHGKTSQNLCSLKAEWVADTAATPDLKVAENIHHYTDSGTAGIKEDEMRERCCSERALRAEEYVCGNGKMAETPVVVNALVLGHALPCFADGRDGERRWENGRRSLRWLFEDLVL